jgi:phosphoglycerate-specific signal transduction histidine kinase
MSYTTVAHCGTDHQEWLKAIDFYDNELDILEERLTEVVKKNNSEDALKGVEHFQNQFIIQRNTIDELRHNINEHAHKVATDVQSHAGRIETQQVKDHDTVKEEFESFEKVINELRDEFKLYLSKWM